MATKLQDAGASKTWFPRRSVGTNLDIGTDCSRALTGTAYEYDNGRHSKMMSTDMHGTWYGDTATALAAVSCANFNIKVCSSASLPANSPFTFCIDR